MSESEAANPYDMSVIKVVCGGETGADRAAVDFALLHSVAYGGWVPRDGWAEDFREPPGLLVHYHRFVPTLSTDLGVRTTLNVRDSSATVVFSPGIIASSGVDQTLTMANVLKRPIVVIDPLGEDADALFAEFFGRLGTAVTLNVAGPRESEVPGLYRSVLAFLQKNARFFAPTSA